MGWVEGIAKFLKTLKEVLGKNLRNLRESRGLTQESLADKADVDVKVVQRIEQTVSWPDYDSIVKICEALDVSETELFSVSESDQQTEQLNMIRTLTRLWNFLCSEKDLSPDRRKLLEVASAIPFGEIETALKFLGQLSGQNKQSRRVRRP